MSKIDENKLPKINRDNLVDYEFGTDGMMTLEQYRNQLIQEIEQKYYGANDVKVRDIIQTIKES